MASMRIKNLLDACGKLGHGNLLYRSLPGEIKFYKKIYASPQTYIGDPQIFPEGANFVISLFFA